MRKRLWIPLALLCLCAAAFLLFALDYYRADASAEAALRSDALVRVERTEHGWFFDGPERDDALIFYPGAKVEAAAYAPLLRRVAAGGTDVFLVEMPLRFAFLGMDRAEEVMAEHDYARWAIGGHSLGGAVAANYVSAHPGVFDALVLCAAYPTKPLGELREISLSGSEDGVLNRAKLEAGRAFAPPESAELVIEGGNHARFGSYGEQRGDGEASISAEEQQTIAAAFILSELDKAA